MRRTKIEDRALQLERALDVAVSEAERELDWPGIRRLMRAKQRLSGARVAVHDERVMSAS